MQQQQPAARQAPLRQSDAHHAHPGDQSRLCNGPRGLAGWINKEAPQEVFDYVMLDY